MNYALVIGIDHYPTRPLSGAVRDARNMATWLKENNLVEESKIKLLTSDEQNDLAKTDHVDMQFVEIISDAKLHATEKNRLYFYFSGHGIGVSYNNTGLCLRLWGDALPGYSISSRAYHDALFNQALFDEIIIFLDCCRDYDFLITPKPPDFDTTFVETRQTDFIIFYSTIFGKVSYEIGKDRNNKHGAFTSFLMEGLKGDADMDGDGHISASDLMEHIAKNFKSYALNHKKDQDADAEVNLRGRNIIICDVMKNELNYNYVITFKRKSNVTLFDGSSNPIPEATALEVQEGQTLNIKLPKGLIKIMDNNSKEEKYFTNFNLNSISNEQF